MAYDVGFGESFGNFFGLIGSIFKNDIIDVIILLVLYILISALVVGLRIYWLQFLYLIPNIASFKWAADRARGDRTRNIFQSLSAIFTGNNVLSVLGMVLLMTLVFPFTYMFAGAIFYPVFSFIATDNVSFADAFRQYFRVTNVKIYFISFALLFCAYLIGFYLLSEVTTALMGCVIGAELAGGVSEGPVTATTYPADDYANAAPQPVYTGAYDTPATADVPAGVVQDAVTPEQPAYV